MTQPAPKRTDTPEVWPLVVTDVRAGVYGVLPYWADRLAVEMEARNEFGRQKYGIGIGLQVENGRDPLRDALDEALDLCVYTRQQYERTGRSDDLSLHQDAVVFASRVQWRIHLRASEDAP